MIHFYTTFASTKKYFNFPKILNANKCEIPLLIIFTIFIGNLIAQPTITSFTPTSGPVGTSITITGTNFDPTPANNIVFFGATRATVSAATNAELTVTVPIGATYQPITVLVNGLIAWSSAPFVVTFDGGGVIHANSFDAKVDFTTGIRPQSVSIGDMDSDGKADLAVTNYYGNTVSLFRNTSVNDGIISYATKVDYVTGDHVLGSIPYSISIGDLDADGKADLALTNYNADYNTLSIFRNISSGAGTISYAPKVDYMTGTNPGSIAIGDLDGDGKADLAVTNLVSNTVSIFRNTGISTGTISFATKVDFTTGDAPVSVIIGDFDGDRKADLTVVNIYSNTVSVFRNTSTVGTISFATKVDFTTGTYPEGVAIGDLDNDGKADLAVANSFSDTLSIFRNSSTGAGVISFAPKVDFVSGRGPRSVAIGDLDGDGKADLAVANISATVSVFRNTSTVGTISFATKVDYTTGYHSTSVTIGDLDGDGKADLAVVIGRDTTVSVLRNKITNENLNTETDIIAFSLSEQTGATTFDAVNHTIDIEILKNSDITSLIASFELSSGAAAIVNSVNQVSGTNVNDFTNQVTYTITAHDGVTIQDWVVTVRISTRESIDLVFNKWEEFHVNYGASIDEGVSVPDGLDDLFFLMKKTTHIGYSGTWNGGYTLKKGGEIIVEEYGSHDFDYHIKNPEGGWYELNIWSSNSADGFVKFSSAIDTLQIGEWRINEVLRPYGNDWTQIDIPENQETLYFETEGVGLWSGFDVWHEVIGNDAAHWYFNNWGKGYHIEGKIIDPKAGRYYIRYMDSGVMQRANTQVRDYMINVGAESIVEEAPFEPKITGLSSYDMGNELVTVQVLTMGKIDSLNCSILISVHDTIEAQKSYLESISNKFYVTFDFTDVPIGEHIFIVRDKQNNVIYQHVITINEVQQKPLNIEFLGRNKLRIGRWQKVGLNYYNLNNSNLYNQYIIISYPRELQIQVKKPVTYYPAIDNLFTSPAIIINISNIYPNDQGQVEFKVMGQDINGDYFLNAYVTNDLSAFLKDYKTDFAHFNTIEANGRLGFNKFGSTRKVRTASNLRFKIFPEGYILTWIIKTEEGPVYHVGISNGTGGMIHAWEPKVDEVSSIADLSESFQFTGAYKPHKEWTADLGEEMVENARLFDGEKYDRYSKDGISCLELIRASMNINGVDYFKKWYPYGTITEIKVKFCKEQSEKPFEDCLKDTYTNEDLLSWLKKYSENENSPDGNLPDFVDGDLEDQGTQPSDSLGFDPVGSSTPEDKYGITGFGENGSISKEQKHSYKIDFWNHEDATANAQEVFIKDTLDLDFNDATLEFTEFGFLGWTVPLEGGQYFNINVDMRPEMDLRVNVEGKYDPDSREISWVFRSMDPVTLDYPEDPLAGFLPPIDSTGYQIGWVQYEIEPNENLPDGATLTNQAWVNFDGVGPTNPAPKEAPWSNMIDDTAPESYVQNLPQVVNADSVLVQWQGTDAGAGIQDYAIFVSENDKDYSSWVSSASYESQYFYGEYGKTYYFYSIAKDFVGIEENAKSAYEAMVKFEAITGIEDNSAENNANELLIYPNPSECCFTVRSHLNCTSTKTIGVFNTTGEKVMEKQYDSEEITIDLSNYVRGMYFVKVTCGNDMVIGKIVNY